MNTTDLAPNPFDSMTPTANSPSKPTALIGSKWDWSEYSRTRDQSEDGTTCYTPFTPITPMSATMPIMQTDEEIVQEVYALWDMYKVAERNQTTELLNLKAATQVAEDRRNRLQEHVRKMGQRCEGEMQSYEKMTQILLAYQNGAISASSLEEVCNVLTESMVKQDNKLVSAEKLVPIDEDIEEMLTKVPQLTKTAPSGRRKDEILLSLVEELVALQCREKQKIDSLEADYVDLQHAQRNHGSLVGDYNHQAELLQKLQKEECQSQRELKILMDEADLNYLSEDELEDLSSRISKYLRNAEVVLAMHQIESYTPQRATVGLEETTNGKCTVCYERRWNTALGPCGHFLCRECAMVMKTCPICREVIERTQPVATTRPQFLPRLTPLPRLSLRGLQLNNRFFPVNKNLMGRAPV